MGQNPRSSWPRSKWQPHYFCALCGGELVKTCELQFDSGSVEPVEDETLTGATSGDTGVVDSVTLESGTWAGGDAAGTVYLSSLTGISEDDELFEDNELITGSTGGVNIMTVNGDGIVKSNGLPYPAGETGLYKGKRYCTAHLAFKQGQDKYNYKLNLGD